MVLAHPDNFLLLNCWIPTRTSITFFTAIMQHLDNIRTENFEICDPRLSHAPAVITMVPAFLNGAVGSRIPNNEVWLQALKSDPLTNTLLEIVANPGLSQDKKEVDFLHHIYK